MAKKARTPTPPRPVQAPKKRETPRAPRTSDDRRRLLLLVAFAASGLIALGVVLGFVLTRGSSTAKPGPTVPGALPGLQAGKGPWPPEYAHLPDRLAPLGLHSLPTEGVTLHIHQHLDIYVNGKHLPVPALIGIYANGDPSVGGFFVELHTHDTTGVMHLESPRTATFTLGQFFGVWGVRFNKNCIGGYCAAPGKPLRVYVNGKLFHGDPTTIALKAHQEFAVVYGKAPKKIPSKYSFPQGE